MSRLGITYQDVEEAAAELLRLGVQPTHQGVRDLLGRGSYTTIGKHLHEWRSVHSSALFHDQQVPAPPDPVADAVSKVWRELHDANEQKLAAIKQEYDDATQAHQAQADALVAQAQRDVATMAHTLDVAQAKCDLLAQQWQQERARVDLLQQEITQHRAAVAAHRRAQQLSSREAERLQTWLSTLQRDTEQRIAHTRHTATQVIRQLNQQHTAHEAARQAQHVAETTLLHERITHGQQQLALAQQENAALKKLLEQQHAAAATTQMQLQKALERAEKHVDALERRLAVAEQTNTVLAHIDDGVETLAARAGSHQQQLQKTLEEFGHTLRTLLPRRSA